MAHRRHELALGADCLLGGSRCLDQRLVACLELLRHLAEGRGEDAKPAAESGRLYREIAAADAMGEAGQEAHAAHHEDLGNRPGRGERHDRNDREDHEAAAEIGIELAQHVGLG